MVVINAKCNDCVFTMIKGATRNGYAPRDIGLPAAFGDYLKVDYCLDCGQLRGDFPVPLTEMEEGNED